MPLLAMMETQAERSAPPAMMAATVADYGRIPARLQRSRKRGAKMPPQAVWVGRPTVLANPFHFERFGHARSVLMHEEWLDGAMSDLVLEQRGFCPAEIDALHRLRDRVHRRLLALRRRDLVCWCPITSRWCHGNTLLRRANEDIPRAEFFRAGAVHL